METRELRKFGLALTAVIVVLWLVFSPAMAWHWPAVVVAVVALAAILFPRTMTPLHWLLSKIGHAISRVTTPLLLGLLYFLVMTPLGLVMRLFGHDPMHREIDREASTYRLPSAKIRSRDFERRF